MENLSNEAKQDIEKINGYLENIGSIRKNINDYYFLYLKDKSNFSNNHQTEIENLEKQIDKSMQFIAESKNNFLKITQKFCNQKGDLYDSVMEDIQEPKVKSGDRSWGISINSVWSNSKRGNNWNKLNELRKECNDLVKLIGSTLDFIPYPIT